MTTAPTETAITEAAMTETELVTAHIDLVHKLVSQMARRVPAYVSRDDLTSAGMAGLATAARQYDPQRGIPFDRYAVTRVRGAMIDELRSSDWASRPVRSKARAIAQANEDLTAKLGRAPSQTELADKVGMSVNALDRLSNDVHRAVVLNYESIVDTGDADVLLVSRDADPEEEYLAHERASCVTNAINALPARLQVVIRGYFFEERTVADIADELGVTQSRVSQLRSEAIELLRDGVNAQLDPSALKPLRRSTGRVSRRQSAYRAALAS